TFTVSAIDSGVRKPERNTLSPSRVTSRSSWMGRRRPRVRRAIFSRTELEPISTAAKVGMSEGQQFTCPVPSGHQGHVTRTMFGFGIPRTHAAEDEGRAGLAFAGAGAWGACS